MDNFCVVKQALVCCCHVSICDWLCPASRSLLFLIKRCSGTLVPKGPFVIIGAKGLNFFVLDKRPIQEVDERLQRAYTITVLYLVTSPFGSAQ